MRWGAGVVKQGSLENRCTLARTVGSNPLRIAGGPENRCTLARTVGSNPALSASFFYFDDVV